MAAEPATITITAPALRAFWQEVLAGAGVQDEPARILATIQVEADLRGVHSHGTRGILGYIHQMGEGSMDPTAPPSVVRDAAAMALLDGQRGIGQVSAHAAMRLAMDKAKQGGVGVVGLRNSNHFGAAAYYPMMAAAEGMIGFATSGHRRHRGNMAAYGSVTPLLANHPLAWAIPAGDEPSIVLDMATGVVAMGKVGLARRDGRRLPPGWALTSEGKPTQDATEAAIIAPLGPKGSGLSIVMSVLGGFLVNSGLPESGEIGHFFLALNVGHFVPPVEFGHEVDERIRDIRQGVPAPGHDRVYVPGEIEWLTAERRRREGIPMHAGDVGEFHETAARLGVTTRLG